MKLAITGKGGVGKTTLAVLLGEIYKKEGKKVILVDADPDANLASALGITSDIPALSEMVDLIEERTKAKPGTYGKFFKLNPKVDDIPDKFCLIHNGFKLIRIAKPKKGGSGCYCPENVFLKRLVNHLILKRDEVVILDMEAGFEHLSRGTAQGVDGVIIVVEPGKKSIDTAKEIRKMAKDLDIENVFIVGNKIRSDEDKNFIRKFFNNKEILGFIRFSNEVINADMNEIPIYKILSILEDAKVIKEKMERLKNGS